MIDDLLKSIRLVPGVVEHLSDDALVMLEMEAVKRRDMREPKRRDKTAFEKEIFSLIRRRFRRQKRKLLQRLAVMTGRKSDPVYIDWLDYFYEEDENNEDEQYIRGKLVRLVTRAIRAGIDIFGDEIGIDYDWTGVNAEALEFAARYTYELVRNIDKTTIEVLRKQVSAFIETPGMTIGDLADSLPFGDRRSLTVAVTETTRAYAEGQKLAGEQLKKDFPDVKVTKTWFTNNDEKVCEICEPLNMTTVEFGETFPGGLDAPPAHPNCRCWESTRTRING